MRDNAPAIDWPGLYERIGLLLEQNKTLYHKTDDHETRIRSMESKLENLDEKVDGLDGKVDALGGKVDRLAEQVGLAIRPRVPWTRRCWSWLASRTRPMVVGVLSALGMGVGGYLIAWLTHH